jgi:hypothetical protein
MGLNTVGSIGSGSWALRLMGSGSKAQKHQSIGDHRFSSVVPDEVIDHDKLINLSCRVIAINPKVAESMAAEGMLNHTRRQDDRAT